MTRYVTNGALFSLAVLLLAACGATDGGGSASDGAATTDVAAPTDVAVPGGGGEPADTAVPGCSPRHRSIDPGRGLLLCETNVFLGEPLPAGVAHRRRDLGPAGVHFALSDEAVTGLLSAPDGVVTQVSAHVGFEGDDPTGWVTIGASRETVREHYGEATVDPFLGTWWYHERGVGFEWDDDAVAVIHVVPAGLGSDLPI